MEDQFVFWIGMVVGICLFLSGLGTGYMMGRKDKIMGVLRHELVK